MSSKEVEKKQKAEVQQLDAELLAEMEAASARVKETLDLTQDVRLPQLRLVQATTQDVEANPGQIYDTFASRAQDEVEVIPISTWKTRAYFSSGTVGDPPTCTSPDGVNGYGDEADDLKSKGIFGVAGNSGDCTRCPQANWRSGGKCQLRYNYMVAVIGEDADVENELPRGVMMHGTSAKVASRLNTLLLGSKFLWSNVLVLSSHTEKNERGQYKVWDVRRDRSTTPEEQLIAFKWFKTMDAARSVAVEGDEAAPSPEAKDDIPF